MTYWSLNAAFLGVVVLLVVIGLLVRRSPRPLTVAVTLGILLVVTAVFDNIMISVGLVAYNPDAISGAFIGVAPLEDFAYAIAAGVGLPTVWALLSPVRSTGPDVTPGLADA